MNKLIALIGTSDSKLLSTEMAGGFDYVEESSPVLS